MTDMPDLPCPIAPFVPHRQAMCLLERLVSLDDGFLAAETCPGPDDPFATPRGIPGWVGLEWLAQAVAAWAGVEAARRGEAPAVGFLVGSRRYSCPAGHFALGRRVRVEVTLDFRADNGLAEFHGRVLAPGGETLAEGRLQVFEPHRRGTAPHPDEAP